MLVPYSDTKTDSKRWLLCGRKRFNYGFVKLDFFFQEKYGCHYEWGGVFNLLSEAPSYAPNIEQWDSKRKIQNQRDNCAKIKKTTTQNRIEIESVVHSLSNSPASLRESRQTVVAKGYTIIGKNNKWKRIWLTILYFNIKYQPSSGAESTLLCY